MFLPSSRVQAFRRTASEGARLLPVEDAFDGCLSAAWDRMVKPSRIPEEHVEGIAHNISLSLHSLERDQEDALEMRHEGHLPACSGPWRKQRPQEGSKRSASSSLSFLSLCCRQHPIGEATDWESLRRRSTTLWDGAQSQRSQGAWTCDRWERNDCPGEGQRGRSLAPSRSPNCIASLIFNSSQAKRVFLSDGPSSVRWTDNFFLVPPTLWSGFSSHTHLTLLLGTCLCWRALA